MEILIFQLIVLLFSVVIHEVSHGFVAEHLGDPTARLAGRLTLNPIKHLDLFGSIILPSLLYLTGGVIIGWAKPVPYNPNLLIKDYRHGPLKVALAGPISNIIIALVFGLLMRAFYSFIPTEMTFGLGLIVFLNILLAVFNLIPIPPLDGSKVILTFLPRQFAFYIERVGFVGIIFVFLLILYFGSSLFVLTSGISELIAGTGSWQVFLNFMLRN